MFSISSTHPNRQTGPAKGLAEGPAAEAASGMNGAPLPPARAQAEPLGQALEPGGPPQMGAAPPLPDLPAKPQAGMGALNAVLKRLDGASETQLRAFIHCMLQQLGRQRLGELAELAELQHTQEGRVRALERADTERTLDQNRLEKYESWGTLGAAVAGTALAVLAASGTRWGDAGAIIGQALAAQAGQLTSQAYTAGSKTLGLGRMLNDLKIEREHQRRVRTTSEQLEQASTQLLNQVREQLRGLLPLSSQRQQATARALS